MKLYFENRYGERRLIGEPADDDGAWKMIHEFCGDRNYHIPYVRIWTVESTNEVCYDVGSHTEFFYLAK